MRCSRCPACHSSSPVGLRAHEESLPSGHGDVSRGAVALEKPRCRRRLPIYLYMHATLLGLAGKYSTRRSRSRMTRSKRPRKPAMPIWLAELYRRRAVLHARGNATKDPIVADLRSAVEIAESQGAKALLRRATFNPGAWRCPSASQTQRPKKRTIRQAMAGCSRTCAAPLFRDFTNPCRHPQVPKRPMKSLACNSYPLLPCYGAVNNTAG